MKRTKLLLLAFISCIAIAMMLPAEKTNRDPGYWNKLAEACIEEGMTERAIQCYEQCLAEGSVDSTTLHNFGNLLLLSRQAAADYYDVDIQLIFDRAFHLFDMALKADPYNFEMATDIAGSYGLIQPSRYQDTILAWQHALTLATTEDERDEVHVNLARAQIKAGFYSEALNSLAQVHSHGYTGFKRILISRIQSQI